MAAMQSALQFLCCRRRFGSLSSVLVSGCFSYRFPSPSSSSSLSLPLNRLNPWPSGPFTSGSRYSSRFGTAAALRDGKSEEISTDQQQLQEVDADEQGNRTIIVSACLVGVLTGAGVVLFNNGVHIIRDFFWDGIPLRGASWLREEPVGAIWLRVILVPTCGGLIVSFLNQLRAAADDDLDLEDADSEVESLNARRVKATLRPFLKALAACVTLGTGNALGPEGPSVEIGASIAKGVNYLFNKNPQRRLSLIAAGSASGISSGFNAAVAGCFFAVESVLWPSPSDSSVSLTNTTSMVILSAVTAAVVSEIGLGSQPAFKVPEYDFRSPGELPLYLLLGLLCGLVSLALSRCTSSLTVAIDNLQKDVGIPKAVFPVMGGLTVGSIALAYPEILYWGFQNVDILLESRPFVKGLSAELLLQLVAVKVVATSLCRASGLVGGYYAPSLFIGAATGMAYGKGIALAFTQLNPDIHLSLLEVASPQAYGLVGMAATLAGVCQVPLTAVLLLFELTQDYRILLPLLGAVGMSAWITSGQTRRQDSRGAQEIRRKSQAAQNSDSSSNEGSSTNNLCEVESSLCVDDSSIETEVFGKRIFVSEAMRTRYVTVMTCTSLTEAVALMLKEKQSCAMVVDPDKALLGLITLMDIQEFIKATKTKNNLEDISVSAMCALNGEKYQVQWTAAPDMDLSSAQRIMNTHDLTHIPVVSDTMDGSRMQPVGLLDRECISVTLRALVVRESLR